MSVYGVGIFEEGKYKSKVNKVPTKCYRAWQGIIERCHHPTRLERFPSYEDCTVHEQWLFFQNFAEWWHNTPFHDEPLYQIDKDLLVKGNKMYGPDTCCFVPTEINNLVTRCNKKRGEYPVGVCFDRCKNNFKACMRVHSKNKHLGSFATPLEAFLSYKKHKEAYIKKVADEWKDKIEPRLYDALIHYEVEITD